MFTGCRECTPFVQSLTAFARIAGLKTLSPEVIEEIKKMGYKLTEEKKEI
jgi:hypothetical protein